MVEKKTVAGGKQPRKESVIRAKTFLVKAITKNDPKTLERIMKAGYPIEEPVQAFGEESALMFAASVGQPECLELLFQYNPDLSQTDICGRNVLHYCCRGGNIQNLKLIQGKLTDNTLIDSRSKGGITPLMAAIQSANVYMVGHCLNSSFNPFTEDNTGKTCLDYAMPFKDINGQNIRELIKTAQSQWRSQLSEEQIQALSVRPQNIADVFEPYRNDIAMINGETPTPSMPDMNDAVLEQEGAIASSSQEVQQQQEQNLEVANDQENAENTVSQQKEQQYQQQEQEQQQPTEAAGC